MCILLVYVLFDKMLPETDVLSDQVRTENTDTWDVIFHSWDKVG